MTISVLIITRNEENNIEACLESATWADEIVIVDAFSEDKTREICLKFTDKVYQKKWDGYANQKNFGNGLCTGEWILSLDADERITQQLSDAIRKAIGEGKHSAYRIPILDFMFGKWIEHGGWDRQLHTRLYMKDKASWQKDVHEIVKVDGQVGHLTIPILHFSHTSISKFVNKMNRYTDLEANELFKSGDKIGWAKILLTIPWHFFNRYILWKGILDGFHGIILAVLIGFYYFLTRVKLWELHQATNNKELNVE